MIEIDVMLTDRMHLNARNAPLARLTRSTVAATVLWLACSAVLGSYGIAQPKIPEGVGPLPVLGQGGEQGKAGRGAGVAVSAPYADKYAAVLPPEVANLLRRGDIAFEAASKSYVSPSLPRELLPQTDVVTLTSERSVPESYQPAGTLPFRAPAESDLGREPLESGAKVLWNAVAKLWRYGLFEASVRMRIFPSAKPPPRDLTLSVSRIYPRTFGPVPGKLTALFRERIALLSPPVVSAVKWLTLRFLGEEEDYLWASSPTTKSVRQLTGSNRADLMFSHAFAPDDLFVWSGKVEGVRMASAELVSVLVPLVVSPMVPGQGARDGCTVAMVTPASSFDLSLEGRRVPQAPLWIPSNAVWTLRPVWKLELLNKDPFSLDVRQMVYVDTATYEPVYRISFDPSGKPRRIVIGVLGGAKEGLTEPDTPSWRGSILITPNDAGATVLELQSFRTCRSVVAGEDLRAFDPKQLLPTEQARANGTGKGSAGAGRATPPPPTPLSAQSPLEENDQPQD
jgi:hypothetical protein